MVSNAESNIMPIKEDWLSEVKELVERVVVAEADQDVWKKFELAMGSLGTVEKSLLQAYFQGQSPDQISLNLAIPEAELKPMITNAKQQLTQALRTAFQVRH